MGFCFFQKRSEKDTIPPLFKSSSHLANGIFGKVSVGIVYEGSAKEFDAEEKMYVPV